MAMAMTMTMTKEKEKQNAEENRQENALAMVSLQADVPEPLLQSMRGFIEAHPTWDQYRLFQAALAGFLVQNGLQSRAVTRCYLANLFPQTSGFGPRLVPVPSPVPVPRPGVASGDGVGGWGADPSRSAPGS